MRDADWDRRRAEKIVEAAKLRRFDALPLGARFRWRTLNDTRRHLVYVKLTDNDVILWTGLLGNNETRPIDDLPAIDREVVELFEPFDNLLSGELEKLPEFPEVWTALADWHANQSATADAMDCRESSKWHDAREKACQQKSKELLKKLEDG